MELKRKLTPIHLWAITVGMVISGQYFGWNYGFASGGVGGMIIAAVIVTIFYTTFIFSCAELATAIPHAGGPSAFASKAMGPMMGFAAGLAVLIEFVFATPAIAVATGEYLHFLVPVVPSVIATTAIFIFFILINLVGVKGAAIIELVATILALIGLTTYYAFGFGHIHIANIVSPQHFLPHGIKGIFAAIPFAVWLYLAIEGGAMTAEEMQNPKKDIPKGFLLGLGTLAICSVLTIFVSAGLGLGLHPPVDYPLPMALHTVYPNNFVPSVVAALGLFGLLASLHGIIIGYSRQTFALARTGYLPKFLSRLSKRGVPHWGLIVPGTIGVICAASADLSNVLIILAVAGALIVYCITLVSLFVLRKKMPDLHRPFKVYYPWVPLLGLILAIMCLVSIFIFAILPAKLPLLGFHIPLLNVLAAIFIVGFSYYFARARRVVLKN